MRRIAPGSVKLPSNSLYTRVYVGPPDVISNIRPVVYDSLAERASRPNTTVHHPYSLAEFSAPKSPVIRKHGMLAQYSERLMNELEALQLHTRLQSIWLDQFNHRFWTDNNARFERAAQEYKSRVAVLEPIPLEVMSPFYREWLRSNSGRLRHYNHTLWAATYHVIFAQLRLALFSYYTRAVTWLAGRF